MTELRVIVACMMLIAIIVIAAMFTLKDDRDISIPSSPASITDCWPDWKPTQ
jgi:hypothetical protein